MEVSTSVLAISTTEGIFAMGGANGRLLAEIAWESTPLGPVAAWPASLRMSLQLCLASRFPLFVWWGPQFIKLYNDAYSPILGQRHPWALGRPAAKVWAEIWTDVESRVDSVVRGGNSTWDEGLMLFLERSMLN